MHATNLIAREAARVFALLEGYDASIHEVHHTQKGRALRDRPDVEIPCGTRRLAHRLT